MKKTKILFSGAVLFVLISLFSFNIVKATVGGPTFIYGFKYNPEDESVYYTRTSEGGRGCPPELMKLSLISNKSQVVFSCAQGEKLEPNGDYPVNPVQLKISELTNGFKDLTPINLKTNKISIDVNFVDYKKFSGDETMIESANFIAFVYQNDKKIADLPIKGCNLEQPFTFAGYAIPGFNKKMILLLSTKGDCWEGGYINETLNIVANLDSLNRVGYYNSYKGTSALALNEGTVTVIESDKVDIKNDTNDTVITDDIPNTPISKSPQNNFSILTIIIAVIMALVVGIFFGNYSSKK